MSLIAATEIDEFYITDDRSIVLIDSYISKFDAVNRKGRFFRYIEKGVGTNKVVGEHSLAEIPSIIASALKLEDVRIKFCM